MNVICKISAAALLALAPLSVLAADSAQPAKKVKGAPIVPLTAPAADAKSVKAAPAATAPAAKGAEDYLTIGFDKLAGFTYDMPDESSVKTNAPAKPAKEQIPADVKKLNNQRVALKGFMLPLKVEGGLITELLILRDQSMCCYGSVPRINEWVSVKMTGKGVKPIMDQAVTLYGSLKVGEMYENGYLVGIYALDGEKMAGPLDL
ncbi:MAG: DUF3299 domain-containing protein [Verrucomicrobia bacterium]|nr:DUF3299 domain-containing protein [Verrucomicrobiota bacterium]